MQMLKIDYKILDAIKKEKRLDISDLSVIISENYMNTWKHVQKLERYNKIKRVGQHGYVLTESA